MRPAMLKRWIGAALAASMAMTTATAGQAYLYWVKPNFNGGAVTGNEPGIVLPLANARPAEVQANLVWGLRAALNVAALQCQFSPPLMTVRNYNTILSQHGTELAQAYKALDGYFKRTTKGKYQRAFDTHSTRTYNGFSTMHAQIGFCETAGKIGRLALSTPRGRLHELAKSHMQEIRNSLVPVGDRFFSVRTALPAPNLPPLDDRCWDKRGNLKRKCAA
ncbi:MAG: hypothetical protein AB7G25_12415 [Sphingomonadaceae bacterium]